MKSYVSEARSRWPNAVWIIGNGPFASVSTCPPKPSAMLFQSYAEADTARRFIDTTGCGGSCSSEHTVVELQAGPNHLMNPIEREDDA